MTITETRNATLRDLAETLAQQQGRKVDIVASAKNLALRGGMLHVSGADPVISIDGVTEVSGTYRPTQVFDEGLSEKLGIPLAYLRRMREHRPDLLDSNVNGWLHGPDGDAPDRRSFLVRGFAGEPGVARAFLSDRYARIDNLDVLTATLDGVRQAGVDVVIDGCDLTERRMYVRVVAPQVRVLAESLLKNYRNPFGDDFEQWRQVADREGLGYGDGSEPVIFAGFVISNSEVGCGAFTITPRMVIKVCKNGLTITKDALRAVHVGGKMDEGVIDWSADTQQKTLDLISAKARDAVATFLDVDYMEKTIAGFEEKAGVEVKDPAKQVVAIGRALQFDQATIDGVLGHFIRGGQTTAGGLVNAITAQAQCAPTADAAADMEAMALRALDLVNA